MKVTNDIPDFTPTVINLHVETPEDAKTLLYLFNHVKVCDYLRRRGLDPGLCREAIYKTGVKYNEEDWQKAFGALS